MAFCALVIDLGWNWAHVTRVQYLNDTVATAAASKLNSTIEGVEEGEAAALQVMRSNDYFGRPASRGLYQQGTNHLTFGIYEVPSDDGLLDTVEDLLGQDQASDDYFTPVPNPHTADRETVARINAVRVFSSNTSIQPLMSGRIFGRETLAAASRSTAVWGRDGASEVGCYIPMAVPDCYFTEDELETTGTRDFYLRTDRNDDPTVSTSPRIGWASSQGNPNAAYLSGLINGSCTGELLGIGDTLYLGNGMVQSSLTDLQDQMGSSETEWDPAMGPAPPILPGSSHPSHGRTFEAPVFVFESTPDFCAGTANWTQSVTVTGIAWGVVHDIRTTGGAHNRTAAIRFDFARWHEMGTAGGGPDWGVRTIGITQLVE